MRGRLIQKFVAVICRLDAVSTAAVAGGGYDADFRTLVPVRDGSQAGASSRRELAELRVPCQVQRKVWGEDRPQAAGHEIAYDMNLILHWPDLERLGLVEADGRAPFAQGDRIAALERLDGTVEEDFADPPGLYVVEATRAGHGLACFGSPRFNLLFLHCRFDAKTAEAGE